VPPTGPSPGVVTGDTPAYHARSLQQRSDQHTEVLITHRIYIYTYIPTDYIQFFTQYYYFHVYKVPSTDHTSLVYSLFISISH
jgi:hypothetical protein